MRTSNFLRVAAVAVALAAPVAMSSSAFAQDQYQRYDYARDAWPKLQAQMNQSQSAQQVVAAVHSPVASDAGTAISTQGLFVDNTGVIHYGVNTASERMLLGGRP